MNHVKDLDGNSIYFGSDFLIKEEKMGAMKELTLFTAGREITLDRKPADYKYIGVLPASLLCDFSKV